LDSASSNATSACFALFGKIRCHDY
jgi:hypothetical protein